MANRGTGRLRLPCALLARILRGEAAPQDPAELPAELQLRRARIVGGFLELVATSKAFRPTGLTLEASAEARGRTKARAGAETSSPDRIPRTAKRRPGRRDAGPRRAALEPVAPVAPPPAPAGSAHRRRPAAAAIVDPQWRAETPLALAAAAATYEGAGVVRTIPPGVSGDQLVVQHKGEIAKGSIWLRGRQRVRVEQVTTKESRQAGPALIRVQFRELSYGRRLRSMPRGSFLQNAWPELADGPRNGGGE